MNIGQYVRYQQQVGIVVGTSGNGTTRVMFGDNKKYGIAERNLVPMNKSAVMVEYNGDNYLVTPKKTIISLRTGRIMLWTDTMEQRQTILHLAEGAKQ